MLHVSEELWRTGVIANFRSLDVGGTAKQHPSYRRVSGALNTMMKTLWYIHVPSCWESYIHVTFVVLKSSHNCFLSINIPFPSNCTPSSSNRASFFLTLMPLGAFCQSPWKPPINCHTVRASHYSHFGRLLCHSFTSGFEQDVNVRPKTGVRTPVLAIHR